MLSFNLLLIKKLLFIVFNVCLIVRSVVVYCIGVRYVAVPLLFRIMLLIEYVFFFSLVLFIPLLNILLLRCCSLRSSFSSCWWLWCCSFSCLLDWSGRRQARERNAVRWRKALLHRAVCQRVQARPRDRHLRERLAALLRRILEGQLAARHGQARRADLHVRGRVEEQQDGWAWNLGEFRSDSFILLFILSHMYDIGQWFSTLGSWRPTKQNKTEFGDPFSLFILL